MKTLKGTMIELLQLEERKNATRDAFREAHFGEVDYDEKQRAFRSADDAYEVSAELLIKLVQELVQADELTDAMDELHELSRDFQRFAENRRFHHLLEANEAGLAQMARRWKKAAAKMTTFRQLNFLRREYSLEAFEELLAGACPSNLDADIWELSVADFTRQLELFNEQTDFNVAPEKAMMEVAFDLEQQSRRSYDKLTERFVAILQELQDSDRLSSEWEKLDFRLLPVVRDALTRVPQTQTQTAPAPLVRFVDVL
jgi:hypothetical protein